jgi:outer membrane protein|tara:strand:- start:516 stop:1097 length:582 start_codon:yes stop_codon:yes gene_type:complete
VENHNYIWATILKNKENTVKASFRTILFLLTFFSLAGTAKAQLKIGYILSERIRTEYDEFKEAESQLQLEYRKVQYEFDQMVLKMDSLKQEYEVKRLMALDKGASIRQEIEQMERQAQTYQAEKIGPQGELMRKQAQLEYDILGKVKKAVDKVAIAGGYDYIIDASVGLLYFKPKFDLTDDVLHELGNLGSEK